MTVTPYYNREGITLYLGDCREILPQLDVKVDLVLTDPPYGFNRFETDGDDYMTVVADAFEKMKGTAKSGSWAFCFTGTGAIKELLNSVVWDFQRLLWMYKPSDCTFPYRGWLLKSEAIALFSNGEPSPLYERHPYRHDCYLHYKVGQEGVEGHPTVKPHDVIEDLVLRCVPDGVICDPFLGSGTTAVAAKKLGRKCIGIEINEDYLKIAIERLRQGVLL